MIKVVGLERKTGEFNGVKYDNTLINFTVDTNPDVVGVKVGVTKIKTSLLSKSTCVPVPDLSMLLNREITFDYDFTASPPMLLGVTLVKK